MAAQKKSNKKRENGLARRLSKEIVDSSMMLAQAFVAIRREKLKIRVAKINGEPIQPAGEASDQNRINVEVTNGFVKRAWVG